jgi:hypothetical protein
MGNERIKAGLKDSGHLRSKHSGGSPSPAAIGYGGVKATGK